MKDIDYKLVYYMLNVFNRRLHNKEYNHDIIKTLNNINVQVYNEYGNIRDTFDVLSDIKAMTPYDNSIETNRFRNHISDTCVGIRNRSIFSLIFFNNIDSVNEDENRGCDYCNNTNDERISINVNEAGEFVLKFENGFDYEYDDFEYAEITIDYCPWCGKRLLPTNI